MERKLLSLPSFFVLLLIAGIAFLAAPVADVQAALTSGNTVTVDRKGTETDPVARGASAVFTINFATVAVKVAGEGSPAISVEDGFGVEDIIVTIAATAPAASTTSRSPTAAEFKKAASDTTAGQGQNFEVTIAAPSDSEGNITVALRGYAAGTVEFEEANAGAAAYAAATAPATATETIAYNTRDTAAPTATFAAAVGLGGSGTAFTAVGGEGDADRFQIEITVMDNVGLATSGDGVFAPSADVKLTTTLANPPATAPATDPSTFVSWPKGTATATSATHVLVIDPADGATEVKVEVKADSVTDAATPAQKIAKHEATVTISARPKVTITSDATASQAEGTITLTFGISINPGTGALDLQSDDITASNATKGSLERQIAEPPSGGNIAFYEMVITPSYTATPVEVTVAADAVKAAGAQASDPGNVEEMLSIPVKVDVPDTTTPSTEPNAIGDPLPSGKGFMVQVTVPAQGWTVLARSPSDSGITSGTTPVDIKDGSWIDLSDFLATGSGGAIDLKLAGRSVKDLVISELMWGNDASKNPSTNSQWIEIYNTTTAAISGMLHIEFHDGTNGQTMLSVPTDAVGPATTAAAPVVDKLTNWGLGENYWEISDVAGGAYGQGGRTVASTIQPARQIISMERKINYANVIKPDHDTGNAAKNRNKQLAAVPDGAKSGSWQASKAPRRNMSGLRLGTPGINAVVQISKTSISKAVVFNEIANRSDKKHDWIELYNPGSSDVKINNWVLSKVTGVGNDKDTELVTFKSDEDIIVPGGGYLLVVNTDPSLTSLAAGRDLDDADGDDIGNKSGANTRYYRNSGLDIPKEKYLLVLRTEKKLGSDEKIVEIGGHIGSLDLSDSARATQVWPLKVWEAIKTDDLGENNDKTWVRDKGKNLDHGDAWKSDGGVTGLGIDRAATTFNSGTPGYANDAIKQKVKDLKASDPVVISEIMFGTGNGRVPQWIELHNPSKAQAVNLKDWRLEVQNFNSAEEDLRTNINFTLSLPEVRIQPNQTVLVVTASGSVSEKDHFPADRIIDIWSSRTLRDAVDMPSRRSAILSSIGFYISISDPDKVMVDEVGNLDGNKRTNDRPEWPLKGGNLEDGSRSSIVRVSGTEGDGTEPDAWRPAENTFGGKVGVETLYYGDPSDLGTPGYTPGGPLPVQLSSFYSKRNDTGAVVITWSTESELDNAGFNILRSQSRTGEFVRINAQLIPGAGTTGEKTAYTWTDTGASPNVLYFYQIEDVSLAGDHRTLQTTRLRGYIGAAGKATTTWGDLKSRE